MILNTIIRAYTGRRRKKLSQTQLAEELIIPLQVILDLESGKIAKDFIDYVEKLEKFLEVRIRKRVPEEFNFQRKPENPEEEKMVLESVKRNIEQQKDKKKEEVEGEIDFSDKNKLKEWTLKDLISLKRKKEQDKTLKIEKSELVGDDLEIEE